MSGADALRLAACLFFSVAVHAFLLSIPVVGLKGLGGQGASSAPSGLELSVTLPLPLDQAVAESELELPDAASAGLPSELDLGSELTPELDQATVSDDAFLKSEQGAEQSSVAEVGLALEKVYVAEHLLDNKPHITAEITRLYRPNALDGQAAEMLLNIFINEHGTVDDIEILSTSVPPEEAWMIAERYRKLKFSPGRILGIPVKTSKQIAVSISGTQPPQLLTPQ